MLRRAALVAALFLLLVTALGCNATPPPRHTLVVDNTPISGGTGDDRDNIRNALAMLEDAPRLEVKSVTVNDTCPEYQPKDKNGKWQESAHCHWTRDICIHLGSVRDGTIWHEAGHALLMSRSTDENDRWAAVSRAMYGHTDGEFPRGGVLTAYGATNAHEDFAEWTEWVMCYQYHTPTGRTNVNLKHVDKSDERYIRHLRLLYEFGAITFDEYDKLAPLFTSAPR